MKHNVAGGHGLPGEELRWCIPSLPTDDARWNGHRCRRIPPLPPPSEMGEVDEGADNTKQPAWAGEAWGAQTQ